MASRLSSILVRDGLVSVKRMEHAFQRQVIYGGGLDTILLEMNMVPEERLVQYLSLATGLPPATRSETEAVDLEAAKRCPVEVARMFRVVPVAFEEGALRVLVHDPVDLGLLEELANELEVPVQPLVAPEYRFHVVFAHMYGGLLDARYSTLAKRAEDSTPISPVGKARTVIVDEMAPDGAATPEDEAGDAGAQAPAKAPRSTRATLEMASGAVVRRIEAEQARHEAQDGSPDAGEPAAPSTAAALASPLGAPVAIAPGAPSTPPPDAPSGTSDLARSDTAPLLGTGREPTLSSAPLDPTVAIHALSRAEDRDLIFNLLLRAIRKRARYAGLLTVQGDAAIGRVALVENRIDREQIAQVLVPLDEPSPFRAVARSAAPHLGPISQSDPEVGAMLQRMGVSGPVSVLLLPVVLRDRVVAMGIGHNGDKPVDVGALSELLPVARHTAEAISRLIVMAKSARGRRAERPESPSRPAPGPEAATEAPTGAATEAPTEAATAAPAVASVEAEAPITDQMPAPIDSVLSAVESEDPAMAAQATDEALRRTGETLEALRARFPGKLLVERYELEGRVIAAAQHGPLLALIMRMGTVAADLLVEKMQDPSRDLRYYATLCASELRPRGALDALVERLFDNDYGIRSTAIGALSGYPTGALDQALVRVRQALHGDRSERVQAAANALAKLADVRAVPELIEVVAQGERSAEHARLALVRLTKQDFGTNARKWRSWWSKSKSQSRVEWLIEGLAHKDENVRRSAVEELRQLTGEYFGFHHDLPKKEREQARQRWIQWWKQSGRHRFLRGDQRD